MLTDPNYQPPAPGPLPASPKEYPRKGGTLAATYAAGATTVVVTATFGLGGQQVAVRLEHAEAAPAEWYFRHFDQHDADYWWLRLRREQLRTMVWD